MTYLGLKRGSVAATVAAACVSAAAWTRLPAGARLPTHWGIDGQPDRFAEASYALFLPVALMAAVGIGMAALPRLEPLQDRMAQSASLYRTTWVVVLGLVAMVEAMIAAPAFGVALPDTLPLVGVGLGLVAVGNALPKSRPGFFVGIRTPWTLIDAETWIATHRLGAWTTIVAGASFMLAAIVPVPARLPLVAGALAVALVPLPYSWWFWRTRGSR